MKVKWLLVLAKSKFIIRKLAIKNSNQTKFGFYLKHSGFLLLLAL